MSRLDVLQIGFPKVWRKKVRQFQVPVLALLLCYFYAAWIAIIVKIYSDIGKKNGKGRSYDQPLEEKHQSVFGGFDADERHDPGRFCSGAHRSPCQ